MTTTKSDATGRWSDFDLKQIAKPEALLHPDQIDFAPLRKAGAGVKHAYTILWTQAQNGRLPPIGTRLMAETLLCDQSTGRDRVGHLERMGLLVVARGRSVYNGDPEDFPTTYKLARPPRGSGSGCVRSDLPHNSITPMYESLYVPRGMLQSELDAYMAATCLREIGPESFHPDEDRWRVDRYGPVGWLMSQARLDTFTVSEMASAIGCGVGPKAVRRVLRLMLTNAEAETVEARQGRFRLVLKVWMLPEVCDHLSGISWRNEAERLHLLDFVGRLEIAEEAAREAAATKRLEEQNVHATDVRRRFPVGTQGVAASGGPEEPPVSLDRPKQQCQSVLDIDWIDPVPQPQSNSVTAESHKLDWDLV